MAASTQRIRVKKIDDKTLVETLQRLSEILDVTEVDTSIDVIQGLRVPLSEALKAGDLAGRIGFRNASLGATLANNKSFNVSFQRSIYDGSRQVPSSRFDEFTITFGREANSWADDQALALQLMGVITSLDLNTANPSVSDDSDAFRELIHGFGLTHRQMLDTLNTSIQDLEAKRVALGEDAEAKEAERKQRHQEAQSQLHEEREKLELQSYKSERRKIMRQLTDGSAAELRKRLTPRGAIYTRWGVFVCAIALACVAAMFGYGSVVELGQQNSLPLSILAEVSPDQDGSSIAAAYNDAAAPTNWFLIIRAVVSSLVAVGALVYAATWLRSFYKEEVEAARAIDQYNYDLVRASWVIETLLEVQHEHNGSVPQEWIEGVTRGLFDGSGKSSALDDRAQALRALMGFTAAASFTPEGPKFDIGKRDARKLSKADD